MGQLAAEAVLARLAGDERGERWIDVGFPDPGARKRLTTMATSGLRAMPTIGCSRARPATGPSMGPAAGPAVDRVS